MNYPKIYFKSFDIMMQGYDLNIPISVEILSTAFWIVTEYLSSNTQKEREGIETQAMRIHCIHFAVT